MNSGLLLDTKIPDGFIIFISGVPGVGKSTISYELLCQSNQFRIIEETDIMREILRGYISHVREKFGNSVDYIFDACEIREYLRPVDTEQAIKHCIRMYKSFENIVSKQQRKGISSIINGVHIIPDIMQELTLNDKVIFINLFINSIQALEHRILKRDKDSYLFKHIHDLFDTNVYLHEGTNMLSNPHNNAFHSIDVTNLNINELMFEIHKCIKQRIDTH